MVTTIGAKLVKLSKHTLGKHVWYGRSTNAGGRDVRGCCCGSSCIHDGVRGGPVETVVYPLLKAAEGAVMKALAPTLVATEHAFVMEMSPMLVAAAALQKLAASTDGRGGDGDNGDNRGVNKTYSSWGSNLRPLILEFWAVALLQHCTTIGRTDGLL